MWMISFWPCYMQRAEQQLNFCHIMPLLAFCEATVSPLLDNCIWWVILHLWELNEIQWFSTWIMFHGHTHREECTVWKIELRCFGKNTVFSLEFVEELCDASMCPLCSVSIVFMTFWIYFVYLFGHKKFKWLHLTGSTVEFPSELKCQGIYWIEIQRNASWELSVTPISNHFKHLSISSAYCSFCL